MVGDPVRAESDVLGLLARRAEIRPTELAEAIYSPRNCDAARQLYRVTAGLESMILGEAEIQGQVRRAHEAAMRAGATGPLSNRLFAAALTTGKRVRSETGHRLQPRERPLSGRRPRAQRARRPAGPSRGDPRRRRDQRADRPRARRAGRGDDLRRQPPRRPRAQPRPALRRLGRRASTNCPTSSSQADIVVSSTASPHPIVGREELELVMAERDGPRAAADRHRRAPRHRPGVRRARRGSACTTSTTCRRSIARNLCMRAEEVPARAGDRRGGDPSLRPLARPARLAAHDRALRAHGDDLVEQVLAENSGRWESASARDLARVEAIARAVMSRLLHEPTIRLRSLGEDRGHASLELVRELFALREDAPVRGASSRATWRRSTTCTSAARRAGRGGRAGGPPSTD